VAANPVAPALSTSADASAVEDPFEPPATRTLPSSSVVADRPERAAAIDGPADTAPVAGSKMSVDASAVVPLLPPMIATRPLARSAAPCWVRADDITPAGENC